MDDSDKNYVHKCTVTEKTELTTLLGQATGLSKGRIKDAMAKGACWVRRSGKKKRLRARRATSPAFVGDEVEFFYDRRLLATSAPEGRLLEDLRAYSVWFKPAMLLSQGTDYGDHCSLLRQVELWGRATKREAFLLHRLDREAEGLMLFAHNSRTSGKFGQLFQQGEIDKYYRVRVYGDAKSLLGSEGEISTPLDGRPALSRYRLVQTGDDVASQGPDGPVSTLDVKIVTGRTHQIRRHLASKGLPVIGDGKYGGRPAPGAKLALRAYRLRFRCPISGKEKVCDVGDSPDGTEASALIRKF